MAEAYPLELRKRVVAAYEAGVGSDATAGQHFQLGATVKRWVTRQRRLAPTAACGPSNGVPQRSVASKTQDESRSSSAGAHQSRGLSGVSRPEQKEDRRQNCSRSGGSNEYVAYHQLPPDGAPVVL